MAAAPTRLYTADFPLSPDLMGQVWLYPLTPEFEDLWESCERQWDPEEGFRPHGALRVALGTVTGRMIVFTVARRRDVRPGEERSLIVADGPLDPRLTTRCFDVWQKLHFRGVRDGQLLSHHIDFERAVCRPRPMSSSGTKPDTSPDPGGGKTPPAGPSSNALPHIP